MPSRVHIATLAAPVSDVFDFQGLSLDYQVVEIIGAGIFVGTDGAGLACQLYVAGVAITNYSYYGEFFRDQGTAATIAAATGNADAPFTGSGGNFGVGTAAGESFLGFNMLLFDPGGAGYKKFLTRPQVLGAVGQGNSSVVWGRANSTGVINGIRFFGGSGALLTAGKVRIFGLGTS
jgi:hypothetical protein